MRPNSGDPCAAVRRPGEGFEEITHMADLCFHVWAPTFPALLAQAAHALACYMAGGTRQGPLTYHTRICVEAADREGLLVEWLTEIAYIAEKDRALLWTFAFEKVSDIEVRATAGGMTAPFNLRPVKAATYHDLNLVATARGVAATVVLDV